MEYGERLMACRVPPAAGRYRLRLGSAVVLASLAAALAACTEAEVAPEQRVLDGDLQRGRDIIAQTGCGACHVIPGIAGAIGPVGPSLKGFARRTLIAGIHPNQPEILALWVRDAPSLAPETGMPNLPLSEEESRHVAAYLYSLR
jgi:mono/diheme cytochrome c family protein